MNKRSYIPFIFGLVLLLLSVEKVGLAQAAQAAFDRANEQFQQGNYVKSIRDYQTILRGGYESGALYLNLGIAYTEIDSLGMAKAWLLQAEKFDETREQAILALEFIESKFSRRAAILPTLPWERFTRTQLQDWGLKGIGYFSLLCFYLFSLCVLAYWFLPSRFKRWSRYSIILFGVVFLASLVNYGYAYHLEHNFMQAVTVVDEHEVYEQPNTESVVISKSYEGYTFRVDSRKRSEPMWYFVRMSNGVEGWIQKKDVKAF